MYRIGTMDRAAGYLGGRQQVPLALIILVSMCTLAGAQIDVNETGLHDDANVYGIQILTTEPPYLNVENISVWAWGETDPNLHKNVAFSAYGLYSEGDLINTGAIGVNTIGGNAAANSGLAFAYIWDTTGICTLGNAGNAGNITITASGGTAISSSGAANANIPFAEGIYAGGDASNTGTITIAAIAGTANSSSGSAYASIWEATGILAEGDLYNAGDITVTATGGTANAADDAFAFGYAAGLSTEGSADNTGRLSITAIGGSAMADGGIATAGAYAYGIDAHWNINNTGFITATAIGGTAVAADAQADAEAYGIVAGGDVNNSGAVTVAAAAQEAFASYAYGIFMNSAGRLTNTGIIRVTADTAYEVYVASGTTTLVDTYNVTLDGDPSRGSLGIADGATLALNDATLTVTAVSGQTLWNTGYKLFEPEGTGAVDGTFADVQAANPNTTVTYDDQGTAGSADDTVALAYTPLASPTLASIEVAKQVISQAGEVVNRHMTTTLLQNILFPSSSGLLADASPTAESLAMAKTAAGRTSAVFVEPYYSRIDKDANPLGFDAGLWGFSAGCERYVENTLLGLHLGYGQSDIEYTGRGYSGNSEDQDVVTGGFSALTRWDPWTLRYGLTGFYSQHDYQGLTGLSLDERETASYDSYGTAATLMAGHIFQRGTNIFLPEAGLDWLWAHRERYTTEATDPSWDTTYSATDDHDLYAVAALRWLSSFLHDDVRVLPSVSVGVRHLLTDTETSAWQSVAGAAPVLVKSEQDRTAITLSGSLTLARTPHAVSLAYDGDYSPDAQQHSIWLRYSWLF